ncbi:MAG: phage tail tape measure protein, partial [Ruthenibacterium sp.]
MAQPDGSLLFDTKIDGKGFKEGVNELSRNAKLAIATIGAVVGVGLAATLNFGTQMESSMAKVSTLVTGSAQVCAASLDKISGSLEKTSGATGQSASSLAAASYEALSASVSIGTVGSFVDKAAKLAVGGFTNTASSVDVLSSVINAYGSDVMDVDAASKILMQTQNKGKTTIDELSHSIAQVTPTAAAMQVSFYQVGAALSTITAQGVPTAQATTQLNSLFAELGKSGTIASDNLMAAADGTKYAGKGFSELMKDGVPLSELLLMMADYAAENGKSMLDMFGSIESGRAALALVNEDGKTYTKNLDAMSTKTDVVTDAYGKMMDTFAAKKDVIIESSKNIAIAAYRYIEKPLKSAADTAIKSIQSLTNFVKKNGDKITATLKDVATAVASATAGFIAFKTVQSAIA